MSQKPENFWTILAEEIYGAAEAAEFRFDQLKSRGHRMLHRVQPQVDLFDVAADRGRRGFELRFRRHPLLDSVKAIVDRLHAAGDKANQIGIRLCQ